MGYTVFWGKVPSDQGPEEYYEMYAQRNVEQEIMCLTSKSVAGDTRLAVGTRDSAVQVWKVDAEVNVVFSVKIAGVIPSAVAFAENDRDVLVFSRENGKVYV